VYDVVRAALSAMTDGRCAYCDGYPLRATGRDEIDHFRPKTRIEFYGLVCAWENLFLICHACNSAKHDQWDEALLRPDTKYVFERYFFYRFDTGELRPAPDLDVESNHRVERTIVILDLNRADACKARMRTLKEIQRRHSDDELVDMAYRFLIPLCE